MARLEEHQTRVRATEDSATTDQSATDQTTTSSSTSPPANSLMCLPSEVRQLAFRKYYESGSIRIGDSWTSVTVWRTFFGSVRGNSLIKVGRDANSAVDWNIEHQNREFATGTVRSFLDLMAVSRQIREDAISAFCKEVTLYLYQVHDAEALTEAIKCLPTSILQHLEKITHCDNLGFKDDVFEKYQTCPIFSLFGNLRKVHIDFRADDYWFLRIVVQVENFKT